jgi:hypothetical protein
MKPESLTQPVRVLTAPALSLVAASDSVNSSTTDPTEEEIARLAYSYWEARLREGQAGSAEEDWMRAEQALAQETEVHSSAA